MNLTGKTLGNWTLLEPLGAGATGEVYAARHSRLGRRAAVKVLHPGLFSDPQVRRRFEREMLHTEQLKSPHVVHVEDAGEQDGLLYMVLEQLSGGTLKDLLRRIAEGRESLDMAGRLDLVRQAALGLATAHEHAPVLVHRDVKPDNLMLEPRPPAPGQAPYTLKVVDFGLVLALEGETGNTMTNAVVGTGSYLSPEQCQDGRVDPRSDLYALGVLFFELVTGRLPFQCRSLASAVRAHVFEAPPRPSTLVVDLHAGVEQLILRCLEKEPERRPQSAKELAEQLTRRIQMLQVPRHKEEDQKDEVDDQDEKDDRKEKPRPPPVGAILAENVVPDLIPGAPKDIRLTMVNQGELVERFEVRVEGVPPGWVTLHHKELQLAPGAREATGITICAPTAPTSEAGRRDVTLALRSTQTGMVALRSEKRIQLDLKPFSNPVLKLQPPTRTSSTWAAYSVELENQGNQAETWSLMVEDPHAQDPQNSLRVRFQDATVTLKPGEKVSRGLRVERPWRLRGGDRRHTFHVKATRVAPSDAPPMTPKSNEGVLIHTRWVSPWVIAAMVLGLLVVLLIPITVVFRANLADLWDRDGILGDADLCKSGPDKTEDEDQFEDGDGCRDPDNDRDGVLDEMDGPEGSCRNQPDDPNDPAPPDGCPNPDNDGDQILDIHEGALPDGQPCVDMKEDTDGIVDQDGCPESDADDDGVLDPTDLCPLVKGLGPHGCPDSDSDKVHDGIDQCPQDRGPLPTGCPDGYTNTDRDPLPDSEDECPTEPGGRATRGCPDHDGDGVPDKVDQCPDVPGPKPTGCPPSNAAPPSLSMVLFEAEKMRSAASKGTTAFDAQPTDDLRWSGGTQLRWTGAGKGDTLKLPFQVPVTGTYVLSVGVTRGQDYAAITFLLDDTPLGSGFGSSDERKAQVAASDLKQVTLTAGAHTLTVQLTEEGKRGSDVGIDYVKIRPAPVR